MTKLLIIGGGAAGLMASICAKEADSAAQVTLLEAGERVGKKLLSTGNGRCNLTNLHAKAEDYAPAAEFVRTSLDRLNSKALIEKMETIGLPCRAEDEGRVYPASDAASSVLDTLRLQAAHLGVTELTEFTAERIEKKAGAFSVFSADGRKINGEKILLTSGGRAAAKFSGYDLAKQLGHTVTPLFPALLPLKTDGAGLKGLNGVRCRCACSLLKGENVLHRETGEVLFKDFGLSGIAVFQLSRILARQKGELTVELDLLPQLTDRQAEEFLLHRAESLRWRTTDTFLLGMFHKNIGMNLLHLAGIHAKNVQEIEQIQLSRLAYLLKHWRHRITGTQGFQNAQVTVGGISLHEVDPQTLESKLCPGLFLAGEILDVDGPCGGYNLQWAWASGAAAGASAVSLPRAH